MSRDPIKQPWIVARSNRIPMSFRLDRRVPLVGALVLLATAAVMIINMGVGEYSIAPLDVVRTVLHLPTGGDYDFVVNTLRLPRMLVAALVGLALGISGAILQGLTRNPLASPDILGINSGAGLVVVALIVAFDSVSARLLPAAAFVGAFGVSLLIYAFAWRGGDSPLRLVLVGIGLGAILNALTTILLTYGEINSVQRALIWLTGSVYGISWDDLWALLPWILVFAPLAFLLAPDLDALGLGEDVARGLGSRIERRRGLLLITAVALTSASVAAAGSIAFVALIAPHSARRLVGANSAGVILIAGLLGAFIVTAADLGGRTLFAPTELPCGLITAVVGAPFFLYLLWQQRGRM